MYDPNNKNSARDESKAQGGYARAEALSPDTRKRIAREAANARWNSGVPQATHEGELNLDGRATISAAVLPNGKRLLTQSTFLRAIGRSRSPKAGKGVLSTVDGVPFFLQAEVLKPFVSQEILESTTPIFFRDKQGRNAVGYDAQLLPTVAEVYLKMRDATLSAGKPIPTQYSKIVAACDLITRALARVGIVALVDEATGYQEVRDRKALQEILNKYITDEWAKWTKVFPDEYYKQLFRLKNMPYPPLTKTKPSYIGHWTNQIVYSRLGPAVLKTLKEVNPKLASGNRARKLHQHLTPDYGNPELKRHLDNVIFLMKACSTWKQFEKALNQAAPKFGDTISMDLRSEDDE